jgi:hypothetical protein
VQIEYDGLKEKMDKLSISAAFSGRITDLDDDLHIGQAVNPSHALFRVVNPNKNIVTAYIRESDLKNIKIGSQGSFRPNYALFSTAIVTVTAIQDVNIETLPHPSLVSLYQGPIPTQYVDGNINPLISLYKITLEITKDKDDQMPNYIIPGQIVIGSKNTPLLFDYLMQFIQMARNELSFN